MLTRQSVFSALFKLKEAGFDVSKYLDLMAKSADLPKEVILFLRDNSPQFQFFRYLQKHQRALFKSILNYEELDSFGKVKVCSSIITRAMIAVEFKNINDSLIDELDLGRVTVALDKAIRDLDYSFIDEVLKDYKDSLMFFVGSTGAKPE